MTAREFIEGTLAVLTLGTVALGGPTWTEVGDAGDRADQSQDAKGDSSGQLGSIEGGVSSASGPGGLDLVDMYRIRICDPDLFFASTSTTDGGFQSGFNGALWLFEPAPPAPFPPPPIARGLLANLDISGQDPASRFFDVATDGTPAMIPGPGIYYLAVSFQPRRPVSDNEAGGPPPRLIYFFAPGAPFEVSGPDGPDGGAPNLDPHAGWVGVPPGGLVGTYRIILAGAAGGDTPDFDCNGNGLADVCDIVYGDSKDANDDGIPDECQESCPGDFDGDDVVGFNDLLGILAAWGPCPPPCTEDLDDDGDVDFDDLLGLLALWGPCPG